MVQSHVWFGLFLLSAFWVRLPAADLVDDLFFYDLRTGRPVEVGPVRPDRVEGFELLYATPGTGDISEIAGHLLLRVIFHVPDDASEWDREHPHDLVISFLADTGSDPAPPGQETVVVVAEDCERRNWFNLLRMPNDAEEPALASLWQSIRGLTGGFRIAMDRQTLEHTLKSYTVEQDRDLLRYRLQLNEHQKETLLQHLLYVRDHYHPRYFFFSQNCGSVMVQVIGEGIEDEPTTRFHPLVAPPHTLIGNLIRRGLAEPVFPSFHSYRKQGFIARRIFDQELEVLMARYPKVWWPPREATSSPDEVRRSQALLSLKGCSDLHPESVSDVFRLLALFQEADMVFSEKGRRCENYTSEATATARKLQAASIVHTGCRASSNQALPIAH